MYGSVHPQHSRVGAARQRVIVSVRHCLVGGAKKPLHLLAEDLVRGVLTLLAQRCPLLGDSKRLPRRRVRAKRRRRCCLRRPLHGC